MLGILHRILIPIIIYLFLSFLFWYIETENKKQLISASLQNIVILQLPKIYLWIGIGAILLTSPLFLLIDSYSAKNILFLLVLVSMQLLSAFLILWQLVWKIVLYKDEDYFLYRTFWKNIRRISYSCCRYEGENDDVLRIFCHNRVIRVEKIVTNYPFLLAMLQKHNVPRKNLSNNYNGEVCITIKRSEIWIMSICSICFLLFAFFPNIFPSVKVSGDWTVASFLFLSMSLFSVFHLFKVLFWRIQVFPEKDHFFYRNRFGKTVQIFYEEVLHFKQVGYIDYLIVYTKKGKIYIPNHAKNRLFFQKHLTKQLKRKP